MQIAGALVGRGTEFYNLGCRPPRSRTSSGSGRSCAARTRFPSGRSSPSILDLQCRGGAGSLGPRGRRLHRGPQPLDDHRRRARRLEPGEGTRVLRGPERVCAPASARAPQPAGRAAGAEAAIVAEPAVGDRQALRADGSLIYDGAFSTAGRSGPGGRRAWAATNGPNLVRFRFNPERLRLLEALWRDLRARGVQIVAYIPPYHPAAWRVMAAEPRQHEALDEMRAAIAALAARMKCPSATLPIRRRSRAHRVHRLRRRAPAAVVSGKAPPTPLVGGLTVYPVQASRASHTRSCSSSLKVGYSGSDTTRA